jgi:hypothetical protein
MADTGTSLALVPEQPDPDALTVEDLEAIVGSEVQDAVEFIEEWLGHKRAQSTEYYRGDLFGNEEEGRSKYVSREVRDAVQSILPSLMRVFFSSERAVEFIPKNQEDVPAAEQATDYINWIILQDNPGFHTFYTVFKDALYNKAGIVKYWMDESVEVTFHEFTGLSDAAVAQLMQEPGVEIQEVRTQEAGPASSPELSPPRFHDLRVKRVRRSPRVRIAALPPEEFLIDRHAKSIEEARYVGHRTLKSVADLVAMGYDRDQLEELVSHSGTFDDAHEVYTRYQDLGGYWQGDNALNEAERPVLYCEHYIRVDWDGDGYDELRKICTLGEGFEIVANDPIPERPFVDFCVDPEPHRFWGEDIADQVKDLQEIKSAIIRNILDSLAQSIYPRTAVVEGRVNIEDVLNTEVGAIMRMDAPGMVQPFAMPFVGQQALPVLEMLDMQKKERVGTHNMALDADALQSTTKAAVDAQVQSARDRLELITRLIAEHGMKRLFAGLLRLVVANQDQSRMLRLRGRWAEVDPSTWNASMDVAVNVGLGNGLTEDRIHALSSTLEAQREVLMQMGPENPLVGFGRLRNTLAKLLELSGYKDVDQFWQPLELDYVPPPPPPPPPTPEEVIAQVEMQKIQADMMNDRAKLELERDKLIAEIHLKAAELGIELDIAKLKRDMEANRLQAQQGRSES